MFTCSSSKLNKIPNDYSIPIFAIFLENRRRTKGLKKIYWNGVFLIFVAGIVPIYFFLSFKLTIRRYVPYFPFKRFFNGHTPLSFLFN